jgi:hypothetical protein
VLRVVSWAASAASFIAYAVHKGSVVAPSDILDGTFLWISLGSLFLPFVRSLKIGKIFELEREVEKTKETVREVRDDVRQSLTILASSLSAAASARATVNNVVAVQGAEEHPERPRESPPETPRSAAELRILNTLWRFQVERFPDLMPRFTFRITAPPADAESFSQAAQRLVFEGLIGQNQELQVFLTDGGLRYCKDNFRSFPVDTYFERPVLTEENLTKAVARLKEVK